MESLFGVGAGPPPQQPGQQPPQPQHSPEEIAGSRRALEATIEGLINLVSRPKGELTRKEVFNEVSDMIANGAFPTPESRQQLIVGLSKLPNEEDAIRESLGNYLLAAAVSRSQFHDTFGPAPEDGMIDAIRND